LNTWWLLAEAVVVVQLQTTMVVAVAVQADIEQRQDLQWLPAHQLQSQSVTEAQAAQDQPEMLDPAELADQILFFHQ